MQEIKRAYVDFRVLNVIPTKDKFGYRVILVYPDGTEETHQRGGFLSKKAADLDRTETIGKLYTGTFVVYDGIKVKDFLTYWLEEEKKPELTYNSYMSYRNAINNHIIPEIGERYLSSLMRSDILDLYKKKMATHKSVLKIIKPVLVTSMRFASKKKMIEYNPAEKVELPKDGTKKNAFRVRSIDVKKTLNQEEVERLIEASEKSPIHMPILFAVLMGLRRNEIYGLKYADVNYADKTLHVQRQLGVKANSKKEEYKGRTYTKQEIKLKTESSDRILPIPDVVFEAILEERKRYEKNRRRRSREFHDNDFICCSSYGNSRSKGFHFKYFKSLLKENDLPDIRWHGLRTTYCTMLLKNDFNPKVVSKLMGHAKEIITIDTYGDNSEIVEDCLDVLEPFIEEVTSNNLIYADFADGEFENEAEAIDAYLMAI